MFDSQTRSGPAGPHIILVILAIFVFIIIVIVTAISLLLGQNLIVNPAVISSSPSPTPTIAPLAVATPGPATWNAFRSVALGFSLDYPARWRRKENSLEVIFAPSPTGLESPYLGREPVIWAGIPPLNNFTPAEVLAAIVADFPANTKQTDLGTISSTGIPWTLSELTFTPANSSQPVQARVAVTSYNEVGYFVAAAAPIIRWEEVKPVFEEMLRGFRFTQEAIIRPTDAAPPTPPNPSPPPRIYIVQSGDTLGGIAAEYGVTVEAIVTRNGLEDARMIRTGQKLIIPNKKKK
ncbi:MAG: LysM peptidoglycan-binding domain-containing protein [Anaerolineae bacterium]